MKKEEDERGDGQVNGDKTGALTIMLDVLSETPEPRRFLARSIGLAKHGLILGELGVDL